MAITVEEVNALTDEQITPELEAALLPKLENRFTNYFTTKGHVVKPKTDYDTEFNTALTTKQKEWADSEAPKFYGAMDRMLAAVGLTKPADTKTRDWVQKLSEEGKLPFTQAQWDKIDKTLKGELSATDQGLFDKLKTEFEQYKTKQEDKDKAAFTSSVNQILTNSFRSAPVPIDPKLTKDEDKETARKSLIGTVRAVFESMYEADKDENGTIFFKKKGTDKALMDTKTSEPMSPLQIMQQEYASLFVAQGHQQKGTETKTGVTSAAGSSTSAELWKQASDQGLRPHSKEWKKFMDDHKEKK